MANRSFRHNMGTAQNGIVQIPGVVRLGQNSSGTLSQTSPLGFVSASRVSTGTVRFAFADSYVASHGSFFQVANTGSIPYSAHLSGTNLSPVLDHSKAGSTNCVDVQIKSGSIILDPQNPIEIHYLFNLKNSSV